MASASRWLDNVFIERLTSVRSSYECVYLNAFDTARQPWTRAWASAHDWIGYVQHPAATLGA